MFSFGPSFLPSFRSVRLSVRHQSSTYLFTHLSFIPVSFRSTSCHRLRLRAPRPLWPPSLPGALPSAWNARLRRVPARSACTIRVLFRWTPLPPKGALHGGRNHAWLPVVCTAHAPSVFSHDKWTGVSYLLGVPSP